MPVRTLFLDTNVFLYAAGADHPLKKPSIRWLEGAAEGRFRAVTSAEVLQEILHVLIRRGRRREARHRSPRGGARSAVTTSSRSDGSPPPQIPDLHPPAESDRRGASRALGPPSRGCARAAGDRHRG